MSLRLQCARAIAAVSTGGLKYLFRRPAANFPGKIALYVDPNLIGDLRGKAAKGSICVVGTNGKTTVTNLLADALEATGDTVICNRTGANLDSGVSTALLHAKQSDWGVFESDELWLSKIAPQLKPRFVLLLNLFRDQLDRVGEIDRIQDSIVGALERTPATTLIFNADDPLCAAIAARVPNPTLAFGIEGSMGLAQNTVTDAQMCQQCSTMMEYEYRQYGQLGEYHCPGCGFCRPPRDWQATDVKLGVDGLRFSVERASDNAEPFQLHALFSGAYMVYNLLAVAVASREMGVEPPCIQQAIDAFNPQNGRLQRFTIQDRSVLLNLAKNPTGFNQNLKIILQDTGPKTVAFFINDKEADGRDVSWLWDIDFEELAGHGNLQVYAGGIRANDMQVRLKYAGVPAGLAANAADVLRKSANDERGKHVYLIANYTALPALRSDLAGMEANGAVPEGTSDRAASRAASDEAGNASGSASAEPVDAGGPAVAGEPAVAGGPVSVGEPSSASVCASAVTQGGTEILEPLVIVHLFPDLLNLYGDGGNVTVLAQRMRARGLAVEVRRIKHGQVCDLSQADIVFLGGGPDREQRLASEALLDMRDDIASFVEGGGVLLAICGGYQILGTEWLLGEDSVQGLGIVDMKTVRAEGGSGNRLIDNVILDSPLASQPVVGYENHAGRTHLGAGVKPFGTVVSQTGHGNNDTDRTDGVLYKGVLGTYLHGPLLAKNPQIADWLLEQGLRRRTQRCGCAPEQLVPLDDAIENAANEMLCTRFKAKAK